MTPEPPVEITPSASALIESLRGLGYSPETAIADLVDNSIAAGAKQVELDLDWNDSDPRVALLDDGSGMDRTTLGEALRFGGSGPAAIRTPSDLGRFGLGLKTASLSQCRRLTVISRRDGQTCALVLDVDVVAERGWVAFAPTQLLEHPFVSKLSQLAHGTLVLWDRMDSLGGLSGLDKQAFYLGLQDIRAHLGMVFHRFLDGDAPRIRISTNGRPVKSWDPFQRDHSSITEMRSERLRHGGSSLVVTPYILPHRDRFANDAEYELAGGPGGWNARQGFYVYRAKRLLVPGSWLGLGGTRAWTRDEVQSVGAHPDRSSSRYGRRLADRRAKVSGTTSRKFARAPHRYSRALSCAGSGGVRLAGTWSAPTDTGPSLRSPVARQNRTKWHNLSDQSRSSGPCRVRSSHAERVEGI